MIDEGVVAAKLVIFGQGINEGSNLFGQGAGRASVILTHVVAFDTLVQTSRRINTSEEAYEWDEGENDYVLRPSIKTRAEGRFYQIVDGTDLDRLTIAQSRELRKAGDPEAQRQMLLDIQRGILSASDNSSTVTILRDTAKLRGNSRLDLEAKIRAQQVNSPFFYVSGNIYASTPYTPAQLQKFVTSYSGLTGAAASQAELRDSGVESHPGSRDIRAGDGGPA